MTEQDELAALLAQEVKKEFDALNVDSDLLDACREYGTTRDLLDRVKKYADDLEEKCNNLVAVIVPAMESQGIKSLKIEGLGRIGTASNPWPKIVDDDKMKRWLYTIGEEGVIKETVNYMSLKAIIARRMDDNMGAPPEDAIEVNQKPGLRFSREKK